MNLGADTAGSADSADSADSGDVEGLLPAYVAGELAATERARVEEALARSPRLRAELARYQRLFVVLTAAALERVEPPGGLEGRLARQLAAQWYLRTAFALVDELLGAYGRALAFYLGLA